MQAKRPLAREGVWLAIAEFEGRLFRLPRSSAKEVLQVPGYIARYLIWAAAFGPRKRRKSLQAPQVRAWTYAIQRDGVAGSAPSTLAEPVDVAGKKLDEVAPRWLPSRGMVSDCDRTAAQGSAHRSPSVRGRDEAGANITPGPVHLDESMPPGGMELLGVSGLPPGRRCARPRRWPAATPRGS